MGGVYGSPIGHTGESSGTLKEGLRLPSVGGVVCLDLSLGVNNAW